MNQYLNNPSYLLSSNTNASIGPYSANEDTTNNPLFKVTSKVPYRGEIVTRALIWDYYRVQLALPNESDILAKLGRNIEEIDQLMCDGRVKAAFNNRRSGLLSLKWTIDENGAPVRVMKTIERMFNQLPIYDIMSEMMLAPFYGYSVSEVVWDHVDGLDLPIAVSGKAQRWFVYSDKNELRVKSKVNQVQGERLPPRKFIVTRFHPHYDSPYAGREALFNACYWPVMFRRIIMQYAMQFLEKYGMPWFDVQLEGGIQQERLDEIVNTINQTYQNGILAHPDNTKLTKMDTADTKSIENYTMWLDTLNREIDVAILGCNLAVEVKGGSFAATNAHMGVRDDIIQEDSRMIESSMNQLIEWVCYYNYGANISLPQFKLYKNEPPTLDRSNIDINLSKMGIKFNKAYISRTYGINEDEFEFGVPLTVVGKPGDPNMPPQAGADQTREATETGEGVTDADANAIQEKGIEAKDSASNTQTSEAIGRMQSKGYMFSEAKKANIIFVRHGATALNSTDNKEDKIRSWLNVQLDEAGKKDVLKTALDLKDKKIDAIVTSDLDRASDTADIISKTTGAKVVERSKDLRPWNLGKFTGQHSSEVHPQIEKFIKASDKTVPEGESFDNFKNRFLNKMDQINKDYAGKTVVVVSHHRNDRLLEAWEATGYGKDRDIDTRVMASKGTLEPGDARTIHF